MSQLIVIPREPDLTNYASGLSPLGPGPAWCWWRPDVDLPWLVLLRCPHGHWATLSGAKHHVARDGLVRPSIYFRGLCKPASDEWHVWGQLQGWDPDLATARGWR